jgi:hypothetical protein
MENLTVSLAQGWTLLSSAAELVSDAVSQGTKYAVQGAEILGQQVTENVIKPVTTAYRKEYGGVSEFFAIPRPLLLSLLWFLFFFFL